MQSTSPQKSPSVGVVRDSLDWSLPLAPPADLAAYTGMVGAATVGGTDTQSTGPFAARSGDSAYAAVDAKNHGAAVASRSGSDAGSDGQQSTPFPAATPSGPVEALPPALLAQGAEPKHASPDAVSEGPEPGSNLFVAGLAPTVDDEALQKPFERFGRIISAKVMLHVDTAVSRGFGFVLFQRAADADAARAALDGTTIDGHEGTLQVSVSKHRGENLTAESRVVYVRNIPASVAGTERVAELLAQFGPVEKVQPRNPAAAGSDKPPTNIVVTYDSVATARAAVAGIHGKKPFPECVAPLLAKVEEPQGLREQRLRARRSGGAKAANDGASPSPGVESPGVAAPERLTVSPGLLHAPPAVPAPAHQGSASATPQSVSAAGSPNDTSALLHTGLLPPGGMVPLLGTPSVPMAPQPLALPGASWAAPAMPGMLPQYGAMVPPQGFAACPPIPGMLPMAQGFPAPMMHPGFAPPPQPAYFAPPMMAAASPLPQTTAFGSAPFRPQ